MIESYGEICLDVVFIFVWIFCEKKVLTKLCQQTQGCGHINCVRLGKNVDIDVISQLNCKKSAYLKTVIWSSKDET